jgi:hypothetical protein
MNREVRVAESSANNAYEPVGYCPKCGYPVDPGDCPECGTEVTRWNIKSMPPRVLLRRRLRFIVICLICISAPYGMYRAWNDLPWLQWLPDSALLWVESWDWTRATQEMLRRCAAGSFSDAELDRIYADAVQFSVEYAETVPAGTPVYVNLRGDLRGLLNAQAGGPGLASICVGFPTDLLQVDVDGQVVPTRTDSSGLVCGFDAVTKRAELPPLAAGDRTIDVHAGFWAGLPTVARRAPQHTWDFDEQLTVHVVDRPLDEFVEPLWDDELQRAALQELKLLCAHSGDLQIWCGGFPAPLVCDIYVRCDDAAEYELALELRGGTGGFSGLWGDFDIPTGAQPKTVDVQLHPKPALALFLGFDRNFAGIVEWDDLVLVDDPGYSSVQVHPDAKPPTSVFLDVGEP